MTYIYLNKQTNELLCFGSIAALFKITGMKPDNLYTHFGRLGNTEFENENVRIVKTKIERGGKF